MASPFPGMDPYLEDPAFWPDFHHRFIECWCEAVADQLPDPYDARLDERVNLVQLTPEIVKLIYPDVAVSRGSKRSRPSGGAGTMLLEPVTVPHEVLEEVRQTRIEILHRPDRTLVAVLEMLSPANKTGDGFDQYRGKRTAILTQKVHLVELDLLLGGERLTHGEPLPKADYYLFLTRARCNVYSWTIRQPLPTIPIPLRAPDLDIHVDLGAVFRVAYERGRYGRSLPYGQTPSAPLTPEDAAWAVALSSKK
ncbi:MAG: DUF4058 family protein [Planctomycetes bacterium]|nr:DUF4058 family protein [Planctomycetota bacterium]